MVVYETKRFPRKMDIMGMEMHYLSLVLSLSKQAGGGGGGGGGGEGGEGGFKRRVR